MSDCNEQQYSSSAILIWDSEDSLPLGDWITVLWRSYDYSGRDDVFSVPQLIEDKPDHLRSRYLAWIFELGETRVNGKRVVDHLELRSGFSYWWMTRFAEKCNYSKSAQIDDVIRLMVFEELAKKCSFGTLVLVTSNRVLAECIRKWCTSLGVVFEWRRKAKQSVPLSWLKRVYQATPNTLQALVWLLRYLVDRWSLCGVGLKKWQETDGQVTFISYLFNLLPDSARQGHYVSRYWADLPDVLQRDKCKTNWLHIYVHDALLPTSKHAAETIRNFNDSERGVQCHVTLDTFLSPLVVFRTMRDWGRLLWISIGLSGSLSSSQNTSFNFWPLFVADWQRSMFGTDAMSNLLNINLFESALDFLPYQKCGVYLQENQGWEFGLIQAWKAAGHGSLIGTPHSTVRFWDLRYFFDPRSYLRRGCSDLPMPDRVTVNGPAMRDAYEKGGYPVEDLVEVEALRYLHLYDSPAKTASASLPDKGAIRVLVLGEYLHTNTQRQMKLLEQAVPSLPNDMVFIVKPHPACPILSADYPGLIMSVTMEPISKLLAECDVAYSSAVTSAALDAYCAGVPIVSMLDPNTLNLSPLYGCKGVLFASTPSELANALSFAVASSSLQNDRQVFFTLDPQLSLWHKLLGNSVT